jgi:DNA-3-methyladenine glycosylase II
MNEKILNHFKKSDPILYTYALKVRELMPIEMSQPEQYFLHLCMQIMSQQLSDKAGDAIFARFRNLFSNNTILPSEVISMPHEKLRGPGMSHAKARYIKHLAQDIISGSLPLSDLHTMKDEEIIQVLTRVKGIGRWTA